MTVFVIVHAPSLAAVGVDLPRFVLRRRDRRFPQSHNTQQSWDLTLVVARCVPCRVVSSCSLSHKVGACLGPLDEDQEEDEEDEPPVLTFQVINFTTITAISEVN